MQQLELDLQPQQQPSRDETPVDLGPADEVARKITQRLLKAWQWSGDPRIFQRFVDACYGALTRFDPKGEAIYMEAIKGLPKEVVHLFPECFGLLVQHFYWQGKFADVLGPVYMELASEAKLSWMGQYFTPWPVAVMMARMVAGDLAEVKAAMAGQRGPVTVYEPALGSGVMLLAFAGVVAEALGRKALHYVRLQGQDLDPLCVTMARVQLLLIDQSYMGSLLLATAWEAKVAM